MNSLSRLAMPTLEELEIEHRDFVLWFTGFFDGEGSLVVGLYKGRRYPILGLAVVQRYDDVQVLELIQRQFRCGALIARRNNLATHTTRSFVWQIRDSQVMKSLFIPLFDRYPLKTKKAREYAIWRELVMRKPQYFDRSWSDPTHRIDELVSKMLAIRNPTLIAIS